MLYKKDSFLGPQITHGSMWKCIGACAVTCRVGPVELGAAESKVLDGLHFPRVSRHLGATHAMMSRSRQDS